MLEKNTPRLLALLGSTILALSITSCGRGCDNFRTPKNPKNSQEQELAQDKSSTPSALEIKHDVATNQITLTLHNRGTAIANMQLEYTNTSPDDQGKLLYWMVSQPARCW